MLICDIELINCFPVWSPDLGNYYVKTIYLEETNTWPLNEVVKETRNWLKKLVQESMKMKDKIRKICQSKKSPLSLSDTLGEYSNSLNEIDLHIQRTENQLKNVSSDSNIDAKFVNEQETLFAKLHELLDDINMSKIELEQFRSAH